MDHRLNPGFAAAGTPRLARPDIEREARANGSFIIRSRTPPGAYARSPADWLVQWAARTPDAVFVAERAQPGERGPALWRCVTYGDALRRARGVAQALLDLGIARDRPVVILSDKANWTLPLGVTNFSTQYSSDTAAILAYTTLSLIPALVFYVIAERQLIGGLTAGGIKG